MQTRSIYIIFLRGLLLALCILLLTCLHAQKSGSRIVVDACGKGNFKSIQAAINSLSDSAPVQRIIFIRKGTYREKILLTKHNIILRGEDRDSTIITQDIARDEWRCTHADDWGVATLNIDGNDITLQNLTIANEYGFHHPENRTVACPGDTLHKEKLITNSGHQMALRTFRATRFKAINCFFSAYAGDTVSPWNTSDGMFYFKDCIMQGGVDFYCPRGWAWAENCRFFAFTGSASIWHDGSGNADQKTILKNCSFDGFDGFSLGRYHRDAQFFLVDCRFSSRMADRDIYLVNTTNTIQWGRRIYFYNCHRNGGDYHWFADNLSLAKDAPAPDDIKPSWLFGTRWQPEKNN